MRSRILAFTSILFLLFFAHRSARADVTLPLLLSDGMVLQEKTPVRIWGAAADGEKVRVSFRGQTVSTEAKGGKWSVTLRPLDPGGPFTMTIAGTKTIAIKNVLVGEVWVCSGQSNMEFGLARAFDAKKDLDAPADPMLRMFTVGRRVADVPELDVPDGTWETSTPETRGHFSAVGYYFGRALRRARRVPIGLIHTSWGGTPAQAWTSRAALEAWGMTSSAFRSMVPPSAKAKEDFERNVAAWKAAGRPQGNFDDPGISEQAKGWADPALDTRDWGSMSLPQPWESAGADMEFDGGVWFRKEIELPQAWIGKDLDLSLGAIDDFDTTYVNGVKVGATGEETANYWEAPRHYTIPASALRGRRAVLAVRVWDHAGRGGLWGPATAMSIAPSGVGAAAALSLAGPWLFKIERKRPSMPTGPAGVDPNLPSVLYNGMLAPLLSYTIQGATWYQGEANTGHAGTYRSLLSTMIRNWRADWGIGDFPFLIVQLAPFMPIKSEPEESDWAILREAQFMVSRDLPNVATAIITDVGDEKDIHPTKKEPVGERLALAARRIAYQETVVASGPTFRSVEIAGSKATITFENVGKGLDVHGDRLTGFALAGTDKHFVFADAVVVADRVVVSSPKVADPAYVRFGWANCPVVNLFNREGLPAVPFRTDPP